jgi:ketosteroid isomerase-like protein
MTSDNEQVVRQAYKIAEEMDMAAWAAAFTENGTFTDESIGVTWQGPSELPEQVENYHRAFPDMHRELYHVYVSGTMVVVQLRQGVTTSLRDVPVLRCAQVPPMSSSRVCSRSMVNLPSAAWPASCA